jgi:2-desacetyl-2-hydroxyethyl bacteriochlorophyllide A dehydrogenase
MKKTMIAAVCTEREKIELQEVPTPLPKEGQVLVKVNASGICGSDVGGYTGHHPMMKWPLIMGHEASGTIAQVGPNVHGIDTGDPVAVEPLFTCRKCNACLRGKYNLCMDLKIIGHQIPGTFAEYVIAEAGFVHPKPDNITFEEAAIAEPASGSLHAVERCNLRLGDVVAIIGCGTMGFLAMQHALNKGTEVLAIDKDARKLDLAKEMGAHHVVNPANQDASELIRGLTKGSGADCVIEAVGIPETLASTVALVKRGGTIMLIGWSGNTTDSFNLTSLTLDELTVLGTLGFAHDFPIALKLMSKGKLKIMPLISHRVPLKKVEDGIRLLKSHADGVGKIIVTYDE